MESGVKELNLIAEDTNQYGQDRRDGKGLAQLMHELGKLEGLQWMRILYAYPSYFTEDLIDEIATNPKVGYNCRLPDFITAKHQHVLLCALLHTAVVSRAMCYESDVNQHAGLHAHCN